MTNRPDYDGLIERVGTVLAQVDYGCGHFITGDDLQIMDVQDMRDALIQSRKEVERLEAVPSIKHWTGNAPEEWIAFLEFHDYAAKELLDWLRERLTAARAALSSVQGIGKQGEDSGADSRSHPSGHAPTGLVASRIDRGDG